MSKRESINRQLLILQKVRQRPFSFDEIINYLKSQSEIQGYNFVISKRTFQRDLEDIRVTFQFDIQFDKSRSVYYIKEEPSIVDYNDRMLEAFDTFNALNISTKVTEIIDFERRKPQGTENLSGFIYAIKNRQLVKFSYLKFWEDESTNRTLFPLMLKEFKNRWYIVGKDLNDEKIKSFALDRISMFIITNEYYHKEVNFNLETYFDRFFGIITPDDVSLERVILSFDVVQGKYTKTLPLHTTQEVIFENDNEIRIALNLCITHDFIMEIMSFGNLVKVIEPQSLKDKIITILKETLEQY